MERRVRTVNKKRESRHILGGWGGNMNPRNVKFQGVFRGRGANEGRGVKAKGRWDHSASCLRVAGLALAWKYESKILVFLESLLIGLQ
jgi:hypothetical protein